MSLLSCQLATPSFLSVSSLLHLHPHISQLLFLPPPLLRRLHVSNVTSENVKIHWQMRGEWGSTLEDPWQRAYLSSIVGVVAHLWLSKSSLFFFFYLDLARGGYFPVSRTLYLWEQQSIRIINDARCNDSLSSHYQALIHAVRGGSRPAA